VIGSFHYTDCAVDRVQASLRSTYKNNDTKRFIRLLVFMSAVGTALTLNHTNMSTSRQQEISGR